MKAARPASDTPRANGDHSTPRTAARRGARSAASPGRQGRLAVGRARQTEALEPFEPGEALDLDPASASVATVETAVALVARLAAQETATCTPRPVAAGRFASSMASVAVVGLLALVG